MNKRIDKLAASARVGKRLAHYRRLAGLTQTQLATTLGITQPLLACYETGKRNIPLGLLEPCAELLGGHVAMFFESTDGAAPPSRPGPRSKLDRQLERLRELPRDKQKAISTVLAMALADSPA